MNNLSMVSFATQSGQNRPPPPPPPSGEDLVKKLDADGSGSLSASEIEDTKLGQRIGDGFGDIDTDGDGLLSIAELDVGAEAAREAGGPEGKNGPPNGGPPPSGDPSGIDAESLFQSLFEALSEEDSGGAGMYDFVQQLYEDAQTAIAA
ncbi:hypothetical protein [Yoonia sp. BS5-3]|uniref:EF-hand domain-containing protein n=1 Tax=Yoonia phaeophyticola TaxID=3137369 RepID=A0ABZ2V0S6_9RHOB